ncbi:ATP-dependent DNA helicase pfh1-like [Olea europaea var. sylvestris]|uniref:ATP-dependent DNA helicase pfh1-like n=1 Tax=Olea europaea var. sylvestris TaxID=158386 RepID=UPI000C1D6523|nr:ATP-dependent DNA helicase pfh1-like [Olea europaea var. sylvestris]
MEKVKIQSSCSFFIDGPGGTGKTFLYKTLLAAVRSQNLIALTIASFGLAASLLLGGQTVHLRFKIPLETIFEVSCYVRKQSALGNLLKMSRLIIWDKAPVINSCVVEAVENMHRDIIDCNMPFGGKVMVLRGDFRQVLPVVPRGKQEDIMKATLVFSDLWLLYLHLPLVQNMRAKLDPVSCDYLLRIGNGMEQEHTCKNIKLPDNIILPFEEEITSLKKLIHHVFPNIEACGDNLQTMANHVILTLTNGCIDYINKILLDQISGEI